MNGLLQCITDLEAAFNTMAAANGFPPVDLTPLPPAAAAKPGLYLAYADEKRSDPPDNWWAQPTDARAKFDLYLYVPIASDGTPLVTTLVNAVELVKDAVQGLMINTIPPAKHFRAYVSDVVPMYDWATRAWAGAMITITADSFRQSTDG